MDQDVLVQHSGIANVFANPELRHRIRVFLVRGAQYHKRHDRSADYEVDENADRHAGLLVTRVVHHIAEVPLRYCHNRSVGPL